MFGWEWRKSCSARFAECVIASHAGGGAKYLVRADEIAALA